MRYSSCQTQCRLVLSGFIPTNVVQKFVLSVSASFEPVSVRFLNTQTLYLVGNILDERAPEHLPGIRESVKKAPSNRKLERTVNIGFDEAFIYLREKKVVKDYFNPASLDDKPGNLLDRDYVMENIIKPLHESDGCSAIGKFQVGVMN